MLFDFIIYITYMRAVKIDQVGSYLTSSADTIYIPSLSNSSVARCNFSVLTILINNLK